MLICKTPYRISFFGGGTDYPSWYNNNGGQVVSTTIDKYIYITLRELPPFFEHKHRIVYNKTERINKINERNQYSKSALKYTANQYFEDRKNSVTKSLEDKLLMRRQLKKDKETAIVKEKEDYEQQKITDAKKKENKQTRKIQERKRKNNIKTMKKASKIKPPPKKKSRLGRLKGLFSRKKSKKKK